MPFDQLELKYLWITPSSQRKIKQPPFTCLIPPRNTLHPKKASDKCFSSSKCFRTEGYFREFLTNCRGYRKGVWPVWLSTWKMEVYSLFSELVANISIRNVEWVSSTWDRNHVSITLMAIYCKSYKWWF